MYGYIYEVTNKVNNKKYIGRHKSSELDESYLGSGKLIKQAIEKYGKENFSIKILEECDSMEKLNLQEKYWISFYNAVDSNEYYNIAKGGYSGSSGWHHTEESKLKISNKIKGKTVSKESIEKYKQTMFNKSDEDKQLMSMNKSKSHLGKKRSDEAKLKTSNTLKEGYKMGIYKSQKGKIAWNKGKSMSDEQKQKLSDACKNKIHITNGSLNKMIYIEELDYWKNNGWWRGRTIKKNKNYIN